MAICPSIDVRLSEGASRRPFSMTAACAWAFSGVTVAALIGFVGFLILAGGPAIRREGWALVSVADWSYRASRFGAASMLYGTIVVALTASLIAVPLALGSALMTAEYLSGIARLVVKSFIELLAGVPSVVYGLLGVLYLRPAVFSILHRWHPEAGDNLLTAGLLVGIMILPTVMSLADDALRSVPRADRETARSLGLTTQETVAHAVLPKALPGLVSAVLLGLGRALGETIAVYLVVGRADNRLPHPWYSLRPLVEAGQTLTSKLGGAEVYLAYGNPTHWSALMALSVLLFVVVIGCVMAGEAILLFGRRYR